MLQSSRSEMRFRQLTQRARSKELAVILCLTALGALLCMQAFHAHLGPASLADQTHCSICAAAHTAVTALCVGLILLVTPSPAQSPRRALNFYSQSRFLESDLFSRPPPRI